MDERTYSVSEVAKYLRSSPATVLRLLREGKLRGARVGRRIVIRERDIDRFFQENPPYPGEGEVRCEGETK